MSTQAFFCSETFKTVPSDEMDRLARQMVAMQDYASILAERIAAFSQQPGAPT